MGHSSGSKLDEQYRQCHSKLRKILNSSFPRGGPIRRGARREWHTALDAHKPVVPVLLRTCRIPPRLRVFQYIDFTTNASNDVAALEQVVRVLRGESSPSLPSDPMPLQPDPPPSKPTLRMPTGSA